MSNYKMKRIAIIMIAAFSILSIVSCGGLDEVTGSASRSSDSTPAPTPEVPLGDNNGESGNKWNVEETKGQTFPKSTYIDIYVPPNWSQNTGFSSPNWVRVSYEDTNRLDRLWKAMIDWKVKNGKRKMFIHTTSTGDFYFDEDYNIRWTKHKDKILKVFRGGAITQLKQSPGNNVHISYEYIIKSIKYYRNGFGQTYVKKERDRSANVVKYSGKYALAGLYSYAVDYNTAALWNTGNGNINRFFGEGSGANSLKIGRLELLTLHPGYPVDLASGKWDAWGNNLFGNWWYVSYALQAIMPNSFINDVNVVRGQNPATYIPSFDITRNLHHSDFRWTHYNGYDPNNFTGF